MNAFFFAVLIAIAQMNEGSCALHKQHTEPAKSLSAETVDGYQKGSGMGLAKPAELNGYPGPRHILDLGEQLKLTAAQRSRVQAAYDAMHEDAVRLGAEILDLEQKLDRAFADKTMTNERLETLTAQIAEKQGRLRYVHLKAHLAAKDVLNQDQVSSYMKLRGYAE
jgi:hypothetical protein